MTHRVTMIVPGETEAGSAGMQPCRGITWRAHQDDERQRGNQLPALLPSIGLIDPDALKIHAPSGRILSLTESARSPFSAEPAQLLDALGYTSGFGRWPRISRTTRCQPSGRNGVGPKTGRVVSCALPAWFSKKQPSPSRLAPFLRPRFSAQDHLRERGQLGVGSLVSAWT